MYGAPRSLLCGADGAFNFTNVLVCGDGFQFDGSYFVPDAFKFNVCVDVHYFETALLV
jgi:hypothetical protein